MHTEEYFSMYYIMWKKTKAHNFVKKDQITKPGKYDISYPYTKFGINRPKQTEVIKWKLNVDFSNSDLDLEYRHVGSNPKLHFDISYSYTKFLVNRPKQTQVIKWKLNFYF